MANPSLQIGNDNWAIKEDNLLGYSTAGTRFVPQPITMTRATLGTRVNPSGLVEDVELLGSELVTNGDFDTDSDWTKVNSTISSGKATVTVVGGANSYITQTLSYTSGQKYKLTATINGTSGKEIKFQDRGNNSGGLTTTNGTVTLDGSDQNIEIYWIANSNSDGIVIARSTTSGDYIFTIDNVSVKEATIDNLPRVDYTDGTSSLLVEPQRTNLINYSEDLSQWTLVNGTLTPNATVSPDGTQNAGKVAFNNTGVDLKKTITVVAGQTYTISFYIKLESGTGLDGRFYDNNNSANIEVYDYTSQIQGTEWSKITRSVTAPSGCTEMQIWLLASSSSLVTASFWGAQFEEGSYPTSYIKTSGSTVTRNQETYTKTGISDKIGQTEGTFFIELSKPVLEPDSYYLISLNNAASNSDDNSVAIGFENSNDFFLRVQSNGTDVFYSNNFDALNVNTFYKIAVSYKSGQSLIYIDGSPITPNGGNLSNAFAFTATLDNLSFDFNGNNGLPFFGKVKQLQVFKTALTGSELATLTT